MLGTAIALASEVFRNATDKGGKPYILHCLQVMHWVDQSDETLMQIAVMHDVIEDTHVTLNDLRALGFSERVVNALDSLTHWKGEPYDNYINRVATNGDAVKVKLADLRHNSDIMRIKGLREKDFERLEKYHRAYSYLSSVLVQAGY